jgi:mxaA protein
MLRAAFPGLAFVMLLTGGAAAEIRAVHTEEPRAFGYFLGDTLERRVEIETGPQDEIVPASLPRTGASNYWLELRSIENVSSSRGDTRLLSLKLVYQTFYAPIDPRKVTIPTTEITVRGPNGNETATIPPFTFLMSPIREIFPEKSGETAESFLRPDAMPEMRRSGTLRTGALALALLSVGLLLLLARDLAWWPFSRRPARPFSRAVREVGTALGKGAGDTGYREALLALHRAFDRAAGQRLFASDVETFFSDHPEHTQTRAGIERFFAASRAVFFGEAPRQGRTDLPPTELRQLVVDLARQERAAR